MSDYGLPLGRLYGPSWLKPSLRNRGFRCIWDPKKDQSSHHCPDCKGKIQLSCYKKLHVAFCICLETMPNGHQHFCGQRFQVESANACATHGWGEHDENRVFQHAKKGEEYKLPG